MLVGSSIVTTLLIPPARVSMPGGEANGRALAYIAHRDFGDVFGTVYDLSTITILWFAGASAMAGLLNLIPRYLPRYGMAPEWARAEPAARAHHHRHWFSRDARCSKLTSMHQAGAYATGVLVLITSVAFARHDLDAATPRVHSAIVFAGVRLHDRSSTSSSGRRASRLRRGSSSRW